MDNPATPTATVLETGTMGRVAYGRIAPNADLVGSIEALCHAQGFRHAFVRAALGSLVDACLEGTSGTITRIAGPAVELVSLSGEIRPGPDGHPRAALSGIVAGPDGVVAGGLFVAGANLVCTTLEATLEEWMPVSE